MQSNKLFFQMSGAPGSGKTALANLLAKELNGIVISHDLLKSFFFENDLAFERLAQLTYKLQWILAEDFITQGQTTIIIDSTCNYAETLEKGMALAEKFGWEYRCVECRVNDVETLDQRLQSRKPLRSQRAGVESPSRDVERSERGSEDYPALFTRWIEKPCRPERGCIVVDSKMSPEGCLKVVLKEIHEQKEIQRGLDGPVP